MKSKKIQSFDQKSTFIEYFIFSFILNRMKKPLLNSPKELRN